MTLLLRCVSAGIEVRCHLGHAYIISNTLYTLAVLQWLLVPPRQCLFTYFIFLQFNLENLYSRTDAKNLILKMGEKQVLPYNKKGELFNCLKKYFNFLVSLSYVYTVHEATAIIDVIAIR